MRTFRILLTVTAIFALALAAVPADGEHEQQQNQSPAAPAHTIAPCTQHHLGHDAAHPHAAAGGEAESHDEHDRAAIHDIHEFAAEHLDRASVHPATFGRADAWSHDWQLRWLDYERSGRIVRVYHATSKRSHSVRYLSIGDTHHPHHGEWRAIH